MNKFKRNISKANKHRKVSSKNEIVVEDINITTEPLDEYCDIKVPTTRFETEPVLD